MPMLLLLLLLLLLLSTCPARTHRKLGGAMGSRSLARSRGRDVQTQFLHARLSAACGALEGNEGKARASLLGSGEGAPVASDKAGQPQPHAPPSRPRQTRHSTSSKPFLLVKNWIPPPLPDVASSSRSVTTS
ncbi:hypothetical protein PMIN01_01225 [Paraphaeosphaeria minitans]|uniref:Uncharacterized protein n=1 Tax=Paraphaeosphaeria minitans TaxID=565426 RepID=A0A9P6KX11_9PLEO|nr:hypothetical protein PMIN01_01225 [Paraphaeosphaeria minitans]